MEQMNQLKNFWKKPEGTTGMIIPAILGVAVIFFWGKIVPFLVQAVENTLYLIGLIVLLTITITVLSDKKFRSMAFNMYKSLMRLITALFVKIDPIGIMKNYIDMLRETQRNIIDNINKLRGVIKGLHEEIKENARNKEQALEESSYARKDNKMMSALRARQAKMLDGANISLQELADKLELLLRVLLKMKDTSEYYIEDLDFKVKLAEKQRKAMHAGYSAMRKIVKAILGDEEKELFDMAQQEVANDYANKLGEMEGFIDITKNLIMAVDLKKGVDLEKGLEMLEKWETENTSDIIKEDEKKQIIQASKDENNILNLDDINLSIPQKVTVNKSGYKDLLD